MGRLWKVCRWIRFVALFCGSPPLSASCAGYRPSAFLPIINMDELEELLNITGPQEPTRREPTKNLAIELGWNNNKNALREPFAHKFATNTRRGRTTNPPHWAPVKRCFYSSLKPLGSSWKFSSVLDELLGWICGRVSGRSGGQTRRGGTG